MSSTDLMEASQGAEDVSDFLRRIKQMGDKHSEEDAERSRNLNEEIAEGRRQREARRAERARSLSPEKQSPASTPRAFGSPRNLASLNASKSTSLSLAEVPSTPPQEPEPVKSESPVMKPQPEQASRSQNPLTTTFNDENRPFSPPQERQSPSTSPRRAGTLSWQQRPSNRGGSKLSPGGLTSPVPKSSLSTKREQETSDSGAELSRDEIAKSLASKDPAWFRQTMDRGVGSAAYRKSNENRSHDHRSPSDPFQLHGMSKETNTENSSSTTSTIDTSPPKSSAADLATTGTKSRMPETPMKNLTQSSATSNLNLQPVAGSAPESSRLETSKFEKKNPETAPTFDRPPSSGIYARSPSPTKGLGGFVQSAMISRSNSITKRWSATSNPSPTRPLSNYTSNNVSNALPASTSMPKLGEMHGAEAQADSSKDAPPRRHEGTSRSIDQSSSSSRHNSSISHNEGEATGVPQPSMSAAQSQGEGNKKPDYATPSSPSKRWSPTKSSWLESALSKPDVPKPKPAAPKPSQPAWLTDLNKNKLHHSKEQSSNPSVTEKKQAEADTFDPEKTVRASAATRSAEDPSANSPIQSKSNGSLHDSNITKVETGQNLSGETKDNEERGINTDIPPASTTTKKTPPGNLPPKPDFRSSVHSRQMHGTHKPTGSLEFQNVFGNLKRTKTEKYVAPDTLKDNITQGKASLTSTGGPQKSVRKDEFKESLLVKRNSMKSTSEEQNLVHSRNLSTTEEAKSLEPEALAKRKALGRNDNSVNLQSSVPSTKGESIEKKDISNVANKSNSKNDDFAPLKGKVVGSKLADRFNPGLAGIIAKGRHTSSSDVKSAEFKDVKSELTAPAASATPREESNHNQRPLEHMTKSRARGPKRRLPQSSTSTEPPTQAKHVPTSFNARNSPKPQDLSPRLENTVDKASPKPSGPKPRIPSPSTSSLSAKPNTPPKPRTISRNIGESALKTADSPSRPPTQVLPSSTVSTPDPKALAFDDAKIDKRNTPKPPSDETLVVGTADTSISSKQDTWRTPDHVVVTKPRVAEPKQKNVVGLGVSMAGSATDKPHSHSTLSALQPKAPENSTEDGKISVAAHNTVTSSPIPQTSEAGQLIAEFFDEAPVADQKLEVDTQAILCSKIGQQDKSRTVRKRICEISGDGKMIQLPSNQEHVLFSNNMYLCTHTFKDARDATIAETYLWIGSAVTDSTVEDVQLFAKRAAKEAGGSFVTVRQGKEPSTFFQALGGICITRNGTSKDVSSTYLLCGRQHLGQVTFDEVDFNLNAFCSGFTYIVSSSQLPKLFLWKGSGCNANELGCARLMSMDLAASGQVVEIDEGQETSEFLSIFSTSAKTMPRSAEYWKLKKQHSNYQTRLFLLDIENNSPPPSSAGGMVSQAAAMWHRIKRPSLTSLSSETQAQVAEITPFCQTDLEPSKIYVLDTFFEIYVLIGSRAQDKAHAFSAALLFAQDYGILAASSEDRPFVPVSTVVLEGAPRDMRAAFRRWDSDLIRTGSLMSSRADKAGRDPATKRGKGLKVVPLSAAIAAIRRGA